MPISIKCKKLDCTNPAHPLSDFCKACESPHNSSSESEIKLSEHYPKYFKDIQGLDEIDVYLVHQLFEVDDPSGCIHHASKKLLLSGERTGGKSKFDDIREARDTLNRWLQIQSQIN